MVITSNTYSTINRDRLANYLWKAQPSEIRKDSVSEKRDLKSRPHCYRVDDGKTEYTTVVWFDERTMFVWSDAANVVLPEDSSNLFASCMNLESIETSMFSFAEIRKASGMFYGCTKLKTLDIAGMKNVECLDLAFSLCSLLETLKFHDCDMNSLRTAESMCDGCTSLKEIDMHEWICDSLLNVSHMFQGCTSLQTAVLFSSCADSLKGKHFVDLILAVNYNAFRNQKEIDEFNYQATHCNLLTAIEWLKKMDSNPKRKTKFLAEPRFSRIMVNASIVTAVDMFNGCTSLEKTDLNGSQFASANVARMFSGCTKLSDKDLLMSEIFSVKNRAVSKITDVEIEKNYTILFQKPKNKNDEVKNEIFKQ